MKCAACGYERRTFEKTFDVVKHFKTGKRKGDVKSITSREFVFYEDDPEFIRIFPDKHLEGRSYIQGEYGMAQYAELYACPKCWTTKLKIND